MMLLQLNTMFWVYVPPGKLLRNLATRKKSCFIKWEAESRVKHATCAFKLLVSEGGDVSECRMVLCGSFSTALNHVLALSLTHWGLFAPLRMTVSHCFKGFCIVCWY